MTACEGPVMPTVRPWVTSSRICSAAVYVFPVPGGPCMGRYEPRSDTASLTAAALAVSPSARSEPPAPLPSSGGRRSSSAVATSPPPTPARTTRSPRSRSRSRCSQVLGGPASIRAAGHGPA